MTKHYPYSPSAAERWQTCPASIDLEKRADPKHDTNEHAELGTKAHEAAEHFLNHDKWPDDCPDEMQSNLRQYIAAVQSLKAAKVSKGGLKKSITEKTIESELYPGLGGTADFAMMQSNGEHTYISIVDLKYGMSKVHAEGNKQLVYYALLVCEYFCLDPYKANIEVRIIQPRLDHTEACIVTGENLDQAIAAYHHAVKNPKQIESGRHCYWCKAKPYCPTLLRDTTRLITAVADPGESPTELQIEFLRLSPMLRKLLDSMPKHVAREMQLDGGAESYPGVYLKESLGNRTFVKNNENLDWVGFMCLLYGTDLSVKKDRSVAQLEKDGIEFPKEMIERKHNGWRACTSRE